MTALWEGLPRLVPPRLAVLRAAFSDGAYLRAWPAAGVAVPVLALVAGAVCGWRPWADAFGTDVTYTSSITIMVVLAVFGFTGAANGIWCLVGYVGADLVLQDHLPRFYRGSYLMNVLTTFLPLVLAYLLLAALIVLIPLLSARMGRQLVVRIRPPTVITAAASALVAAVLVWSWDHTVPTLIRPVYTWPGGTPPTSAIAPIQDDGWLLIVTAVVVIGVRTVLEDLAAGRGVKPPPTASVRGRRPWPLPVSLLLRTAVTTFVLSGLFTEYWHAAAFAVVFAAALLARAGLGAQDGWVRLMARVPVVIRLAVAVGVSYVAGSIVVDSMWRSTQTFLPILLSVGVSLLLCAILIPAGTVRAASTVERRA